MPDAMAAGTPVRRPWSRAHGRTCLAALPLDRKRELCVDLFVDQGAPVVCLRIYYRKRPHELPIPTPLRVTFRASLVPRLLAALGEVHRIVSAAAPLAPDPARALHPSQEDPSCRPE